MIVKYLGHQGWSISIGDDKVVLDIVGNKMGNGFLQVKTSPRRNLPRTVLEDTDFFIISHEHADHFDIDLLKYIYKINEKATFLIPDLASYALKNLLKKIGFNVSVFGAYDNITIGNLNIIALPCLYSRYEPDVYALMFRDERNNNIFFTAVDAVPTPQSLEFVKDNTVALRLDNFTNNYVCRHENQHQRSSLCKENSLNIVNKQFHDFLDNMNSNYVVISGLGWKYFNQQMNNTMFHVHHNEINLPKGKDIPLWIATFNDEYELSETTITLTRTESYDIDQRKYLESVNSKYSYSLENSELSPTQLLDLFKWIQEFLANSIALGCKKLNKAMHYLFMEGEYNSFCLAVYNAGEFYEFKYNFSKVEFELVGKPDSLDYIRKKYVMGIALNTDNLNGIKNCSEEAHICFEIASLTWNKREDLLPECPDVDIASILHPRYRSKDYESYYLSQL